MAREYTDWSKWSFYQEVSTWKKRASWNFKVGSSFVIISTLTQRLGNTVHIRLIHVETSSPKGYKFMVGFEAQKMRNPPSATQLIPNVADYDMSQM